MGGRGRQCRVVGAPEASVCQRLQRRCSSASFWGARVVAGGSDRGGARVADCVGVGVGVWLWGRSITRCSHPPHAFDPSIENDRQERARQGPASASACSSPCLVGYAQVSRPGAASVLVLLSGRGTGSTGLIGGCHHHHHHHRRRRRRRRVAIIVVSPALAAAAAAEAPPAVRGWRRQRQPRRLAAPAAAAAAAPAPCCCSGCRRRWLGGSAPIPGATAR